MNSEAAFQGLGLGIRKRAKQKTKQNGLAVQDISRVDSLSGCSNRTPEQKENIDPENPVSDAEIPISDPENPICDPELFLRQAVSEFR